MSFIFKDADTNDVLDIVYNRLLNQIKSYFFTYSKEARDQVQTICIDMYEPYVSVIKARFPKA